MICPSCTHENRPAAKFCGGCGGSLQRACAKCGAELPPDLKFCDECGAPVSGAAPVTGPAEAAGARKIVTILFADLVGSTALHERLDPESARRFMERYYAAARGAVESHGGTVTQFLGDGVKAVFGIPRIAEDDALRAVRAGVAMQEAFHALAERQRGAVGETGLRVAVNTGEVVVVGETEIIGDPVNVAARLQERGRDGDVVIGESTRRLVAALISLELLGSFDLKGRAEAVKAYRVASLDAPGRAATAFVGREEELARITAVYDRAVETPAAHLAVLLGSPGLGKSRLIGEFARSSGETATVVAAHCDAAGGATFAPIAEALRELLGIEARGSADAVRAAVEAALPREGGAPADTSASAVAEAVAEAVAVTEPSTKAERARIAAGIAALLAGSPGTPEETFFVVRRFLSGLAKTRPVVLVIDDLHWAEPLLLDLVEHLVQWGRGVPLLVLIGARPELRFVRSSFAMSGGLVADVVTLHGLDAGAAMRLAAGVIGATDLPAAVAAKVLATSEGNPLFIGELVRMLVDEGALIRDGDRWKTGETLASVEMPPTIHALLAARIERLEPQQCAILERAAVVGRQFSRSSVAALLPGDGAGLDAQLESLQRAQLLERDTGWLLGEPVVRFHHVLIRDAAYRRLLKGTRAELHERLANWIEARVGDAPEHDETIGRHLEEAHRLLGELGPIGAAGQRLGERAATRLAAAGRRALEGDDVALAAGLLGRAFDRLRADDPALAGPSTEPLERRADLALDWCEALLAAGDVTGAAEAIDQLGRLMPDSDRLRAWHTCFAGHHTVLTAPRELEATVELVAAAATTLASLNDAAGEAKGHFVHALALSRLGRVGACEASLDRALAAARRAGDRRRANTVLAIAPLAALWGPSPVTRASGRCLDVVRVLRITQGAPAVEAVALSCQGVLEALRGRTEAAHRMIASGRKMVEELGIAQRLYEADVFAGLVALLEGDVPAAERTLRGAYDGLRELGLGIDAARAAALLARALLAQDRIDEAEALSHESEALAGDDLKAAIAWRGVRAEALAKRGEHTEAVELARAAVAIAAATDALLDHADARLALAVALEAAGREREAGDEARRAQQLWEEKGATLLVARRQEGNGTDVRLADIPPAERRAPDFVAAATGEDSGPSTQAVRRAVRPNAATVVVARIESAAAARDFAALRALFRDDYRELDHPTGSSWGLDEAVASVERLFRSRDPYFRYDAIATLGPSLYLGRRRAGASGAAGRRFDVGAYENPALQFFEADDRGRMWRSEAFGADRLGDAIARLYERYAEGLPEGPERRRAATTARSVGVFTGSTDPEVLATAIAPSAPTVDHRTLGTWSSRNAAELLQHFRLQRELAADFAVRIEDALAIEPNAFLVRSTYHGTERSSGGSFGNRVCDLFVCGPDGLVTHIEIFEAESGAEALARFEELAGTAPTPSLTPLPPEASFANAASRADSEFVRRFNTRDWAGIEALAAPDLVFDERRRMLHNTCGRGVWLEQLRLMFDVPASRFTTTLVATRGERLALSLHQFAGEVAGGGGPLAIDDHFALHEVDGEGRIVAILLFDLEDSDVAYVELDRRYEAGEAATPSNNWLVMGGFVRAVKRRDWDAVRALCSADFVEQDHRGLAVLGETEGAEAWVENFRTLVELAPDTVYRVHHVLEAARGYFVHGSWYGTREGGPYELQVNAVLELDDEGRIRRADIYDDAVTEAALARLAELKGPAAPSGFANAATRAVDRGTAALAARDWAAFTALMAPGLRHYDRTRLAQLESDGKEWLAASRRVVEMTSAPPAYRVLATRGERLALFEMLWRGAGGDVGPSEIERFLIVEVNERGEHAAIVVYDRGHLDAAYAELDARWRAGEGSAHPLAAKWLADYLSHFAARDWVAMTALLAPDLVAENHRLVGWGERHGPEGVVSTLRAQIELAPDTQERVDHVRTCERAVLLEYAWHGTLEGGAFENLWVVLLELDGDGLARHGDVWDPEDRERALARFEELRLDPLHPAQRGDALSRSDP